MEARKIIGIIKSKKWDICVSRPGFLQSKKIVLEAETSSIKITPNIIIKIKDDLWVDDINIISKERRKNAFNNFSRAFKEKEDWALKIYKSFRENEKEAGLLIKKIKNPQKINRLEAYERYRDNLLKIQKYYAVAEVLADYCETKLRNRKSDFLKYAFPYDRLEMGSFEHSLKRIKKAKNKDKLIRNHIQKFAWILTTYNIIKTYRKEDVLGEMKEIGNNNARQKRSMKKTEINLLKSLQIAIYLRNRIKELSQQLWYYFEPIAIKFSKDIKITRDVFFHLTFEEAIESIKSGKCVVSNAEITKRKKGFVCGYLNNKEVLLTGKKCQELQKYFSKIDKNEINNIEGFPASSGVAQGEVKIILTHNDFRKFDKGDILVAPMTTPDYVILMKKAGAFVTDEGGLSCHAAILARELKKPCIIGTKIATKVLKNGDVVEVDADKGIVKIVKRK